MSLRIRIELALPIGFALLTGCGEEPPPVEERTRPIKILEIGAQDAALRREYPGTISAAQSAELAFEVAGKLIDFPVDEGDDVLEGAVLAKLDPRDYGTRLDKAQANLDNAKADYDRARKLFEEGVLAESALDTTKRQYEVAEADLREARKGTEDTVLVAPFSGTVARKLVQDFENLQAKQPIVVLEDSSGLEILIDVPERDVAQTPGGRPRDEVTAELEPRVILASRPDVEIPARVKEFSTTADPSTRTFRVTLAFDAPDDARVLPGMTAKISIRARDPGTRADGLSIPAAAVLSDEAGAAFVWCVDRSAMSVSPRPVELGAVAGDRVGIRSGLSKGDWVAISGVHHLREGSIVSRIAD